MSTSKTILHRSITKNIGRTLGALFLAICTLAVALNVALPQGSSAASDSLTFKPAADSYVREDKSGSNYGDDTTLSLDTTPRMTTFLRFDLAGVNPANIAQATLRLKISTAKADKPAGLTLYRSATNWKESAITWKNQPALEAALAALPPTALKKDNWLEIAISPASIANGSLSFALISDSSERISFRSSEHKDAPQLVITLKGTAQPQPTTQPTTQPQPTAKPQPTAQPLPPTPAPQPGPAIPSSGMWISRDELAKLPMSGPAWEQLKKAADGSLGTANIADQDSDHDVNTLAVALLYARTGTASYRSKAADAIMAAIGTEDGGRTLALGRNLPSYVIAADLIDLKSYDAGKDKQFRDWLSGVRSEQLDGRSLISTHEDRGNNWGTHAGAARIAADIYIGDKADLDRAAKVFAGWLGNRGSYTGFEYGDDMSWQGDPKNPVGVNAQGTSKDGHSIDGAIADDMRRGCSFQWEPCHTNYPWGALEGATVQADLLHRAGYDAWNWENQAMRRAVQFLYNLDKEVGGWWAEGDDEWMVWIVNHAYGTSFPAALPAQPGKNMGWTDWTHTR